VLGGDEAVPLRGGRDPVVEPALLHLDDPVAALAEQMMVVLVAAQPVALLTPVVGEDIDHALLAEERERPIDRGEPGCRVALAEPAPELLCRHVVALARELLEHLEPARRRTNSAPLEQLRELWPCRWHIHYPTVCANENRYRYLQEPAVSSPWLALPLALVTALSTTAGGLAAVKLANRLGDLIALSGGVVVAIALLDVLPEAERELGQPERVSLLVALGFVLFFLANRLLILHHRDDSDQARAHHRIGAMGALALSAHSFVDGLGIGLALHVSLATGLLVFAAVASHDFADGLNTVSFILRQGGGRRRALRWLAVDATAPIAGAAVGASLSISAHGLGALLAVYVGFFLFLGASDLLPEAHEHPSRLRVALTVSGFGFIALVVWLAGLGGL
jgi:zinc transporter, ZIP family